MKSISGLLGILIFLFSACNRNSGTADAYGNFEASETIISAEASGKIVALALDEGQLLKLNDTIGLIDTVSLHLKKMQLKSSAEAVGSKTAIVKAQADVLKEQYNTALKEKNRFEKLVKDKAATQKQLDDITGQLDIISKQIKSAESQLVPVSGELSALQSQIEQVEDQINKSIIVNPVAGTVLAKYVEQNEIATFGKPLYKIADLDNMILRVYISGMQLSSIKTSQRVKVFIDERDNKTRELEGEVLWISPNAEFTPKIIQTKDERVNLVYAVKVKVKNDGSLKIGMPGEIKF